MTKFAPNNPDTHFVCDGCGRIYNLDLMETIESGSFCPDCFKEKGGTEPTSLESKVLARKKAALDKAEAEYKEARDAYERSLVKEAVQLPEVKPELTATPATVVETAAGHSEDAPADKPADA